MADIFDNFPGLGLLDCEILFEDDEVDRFKLHNEMRLEELYIDCTLTVGKTSVKAHRLIISTVSPYLKRLFIENLNDVNKKDFQIENSKVDENILPDLVEFAYIGKIQINLRNAYRICKASYWLEIKTLLEASERFLCSNIQLDQIIKLLLFAKDYHLEKLRFWAVNSLINHFYRIIFTEQIEQLNHGDFVKVFEELTNRTIRQAMRQEIYRLIINFVKRNIQEHEKYLNEMLKLVPLEKLSAKFLNSEVIRENLIFESIHCVESFRNASLLQSREIEFQKSTYIYYFFGTSVYADSSMIMRLNLFTRKWDEIPSICNFSSKCNATVYKKNIYIFGDENDRNRFSNARRFNPETNDWTDLRFLKQKKHSCAVTVYDDYIVIAGGQSGTNTLNTVERYIPSTDSYEKMPSLNYPRKDFCLVVLKNQLYAIGGNEKTAEKYDKIQQRWIEIARMNHTYKKPGVAVYGEHIYVSGDGHTEIFLGDYNVWESIPTSNHSRRSTCLLTIDDRLFSIGGQTIEYNIPLNYIFMFDPISEEWSYFQEMPDSRTDHCAVVIAVDLEQNEEATELRDDSESTDDSESSYNSILVQPSYMQKNVHLCEYRQSE